MGTTTKYGFRYPNTSALNNIPQDLQNLAVDVEGTLLKLPFINVLGYGVTGLGGDPSPVDDTAAIQAILNTVPTNGAIVYFPPGLIYLITSTLLLAVPGTIIMGSGFGSQIRFDQTVVPTAIRASTAMRAFIRDLRISQTNATPGGTAIDGSNFNGGVTERVLIDAGGATGVPPNIGIDFNSSVSHYHKVENCRINYAGAGGMGVAIRGLAHSHAVDNLRIVPHVATLDANSSGLYIGNAHSTDVGHVDIENSPGNGIFLDTGADATHIKNPYLELNRINVKLASGVIAPTISGGTIQSATVANIQDNGAISPRIINAWPNTSTTVVNYENPQGSFDINGQLAGMASPQNVGLVAWNLDLAACSNNSTATNGTIFMARVDVARNANVTKLYIALGAAATAPVSNQNKLALLNSAGTVLAIVDISGLTATSGLITGTISSTPVTPGMYYVATVQNASTPATLARGSGVSPAALNAGLSASAFRWATNGTGQTDITNRTLSSNANTGAAPFWAALA